jgi:hypothetical protein
MMQYLIVALVKQAIGLGLMVHVLRPYDTSCTFGA